MGRKAWMFAASESAGLRSAIVMSLVPPAKLHGHDPFWAYLRDDHAHANAAERPHRRTSLRTSCNPRADLCDRSRQVVSVGRLAACTTLLLAVLTPEAAELLRRSRLISIDHSQPSAPPARHRLYSSRRAALSAASSPLRAQRVCARCPWVPPPSVPHAAR